MGQDFELAPGGFATVSGTMLIVSFRSIVADSRCPTDVVCVWAGSASADLRVDFSDAVMWSGRLNTNEDPKSTVVGGYELTLVGVSPEPRSASKTTPRDYRVRLRLTAK